MLARRRVDVEALRVDPRGRLGGQRNLVVHLARVIGELELRVEDGVEFQKEADEIHLSFEDQARRQPRDILQCLQTQMLVLQHALGCDELRIELRQRQFGRQHGMLDVEQPVIAARQASLLGVPDLGAGIGRCHADVDDFRNLQAPAADDIEALFVPAGIRDEC